MCTWPEFSPEQTGPWTVLKGAETSRRLPECPHISVFGNLKGCVCPFPPPSSGGPSSLFQQWLVHIFLFPVNLRPAVAAG